MACLINAALPLDCMNALGGLKVAYFLAGEITETTENVGGEINSIDGTGTFFEYQLAKDTAFYSESINVSNVNGTVFYQGELTIVLQKMEAAKRNQILLLAQNRDLRIAFVDNNDVTYIMGLTRGAVMSAGTAATGTAVADLNGYTLTFQSQEPQSAGILSTTLAGVVAAGDITITNA
jgi:hypothetical protein